MIHFVSGDILLSRAQVLAHGVAPNDPMTHGLALALRPGYPALHKDFHHGCSQQHSKPGTAWMWGGPGGVRVVNLITQEGGYGAGAKPGRASAHNVREAVRELVKMAEAESFTSIAVPRLATGVGVRCRGTTCCRCSNSASVHSRFRSTSTRSTTQARAHTNRVWPSRSGRPRRMSRAGPLHSIARSGDYQIDHSITQSPHQITRSRDQEIARSKCSSTVT